MSNGYSLQDECFFPKGLLCELRRYQEWGVKYALHQERVLLGDEMGLGKTIQAIATMVSLKNTGATHFVVVCPASVVTNWCREIRKQSMLQVTKVHGQGRDSALKEWIKTGGVVITTYETTNYFTLQDNFKYRRKREDVLAELPELIDIKEWCTLSDMEEKIYEQSVMAKNYADIRRVSWNVDDLKDSSKAKRMMEIIENAEAEGRKILVFSFFLDTIRKITLLLGR